MSKQSFTLITPCLNRINTIGRMLASVATQGRHDIQHLVIDGGSTDGSIEWARAQGRFEVIVEPGEGLYAAINRGIGLARGDVVLLLNTDDELLPGAMDILSKVFSRQTEVDIVAAGAEVVELAAGVTVVYDDPKTCALRVRNCISGQAMPNAKAFRQRALAAVGLFDPRWRLMSDRDFLLRACAQGLTAVSVRQPVYRYHIHSGSLTLSDTARNPALALEQLEMSIVRLAETADTPYAALYRRFHAYSAGYQVLALARNGEIGAALRLIRQAAHRDRAFLLLAAAELAGHLGERSSRRGRQVSPIR